MSANAQFSLPVRWTRAHQKTPLHDYVRQLVEQVLFTSPGERVNLPDFGSGLLQLPFAPNSVEMAAATQFAVQAALQKWLSNYIKVQSVVASAEEAVLTVTVSLLAPEHRCHPGADLRLRRERVIYHCCNENRKAAVLGQPHPERHRLPRGVGPRCRTARFAAADDPDDHCLKVAPAGLRPDNVIIAGGESITNITATFVTPASTPPPSMTATQKNYFTSLPDAADILLIGTSTAGDFSPYTLRLVNSATQAKEDPFEVTEVLTGFDPQLAEVEFSFKVECPPFFDCHAAASRLSARSARPAARSTTWRRITAPSAP